MSVAAQTRNLLAKRVELLGDETVFQVAAEAYAAAAAGRKVYPFHLGNVDIPTPQNIVDAMNKAIRDGKTGYWLPAGIPELREAIAVRRRSCSRPAVRRRRTSPSSPAASRSSASSCSP